VTDARTIKHEFEERGFDIVYRENADLAAMKQAIDEFTGKLSKRAIGTAATAQGACSRPSGREILRREAGLL